MYFSPAGVKRQRNTSQVKKNVRHQHMSKLYGATNELSAVQGNSLILQIRLPGNFLAYQSNSLKEGYGFQT
jgi:hypothetical protein